MHKPRPGRKRFVPFVQQPVGITVLSSKWWWPVGRSGGNVAPDICCNRHITPPWNGNNWMCVCVCVCVCVCSTWQTAAIRDQTHAQLPCLLLPLLRCSTKNSLKFGIPAVKLRIPNFRSWVGHDARQGQGKCRDLHCSVRQHVGLTNHLFEKLHLQNVPQDFRLWRVVVCHCEACWKQKCREYLDLGYNQQFQYNPKSTLLLRSSVVIVLVPVLHTYSRYSCFVSVKTLWNADSLHVHLKYSHRPAVSSFTRTVTI